MSALEKLSPAQLAQLTLETGALADETSVITIMDNLHTPSDLAKFFATLNDVASVTSLIVLQSSSTQTLQLLESMPADVWYSNSSPDRRKEGLILQPHSVIRGKPAWDKATGQILE